MPADDRTVAGVQRLLAEAVEICRHAEEALLEEPAKIALQRRYGQVSADARVEFAFRGTLSRRIRGWLRRAELTVTTMKTNPGVAGNATAAALLNQLRHLVDVGNVAILRRSESQCTWAAFRSAVDRTTLPCGRPEHRPDAVTRQER